MSQTFYINDLPGDVIPMFKQKEICLTHIDYLISWTYHFHGKKENFVHLVHISAACNLECEGLWEV